MADYPGFGLMCFKNLNFFLCPHFIPFPTPQIKRSAQTLPSLLYATIALRAVGVECSLTPGPSTK